MVEVGHDRTLAASFEERDRRLDLRAHVSGRELAFGEELLRLGHREPIEEPLRRRAEIDRDLRDVACDDEVRPTESARQDRRGPVRARSPSVPPCASHTDEPAAPDDDSERI